jgi:fatty acid desaturase
MWHKASDQRPVGDAESPPGTDESARLGSTRRSLIVDSHGQSYLDFRRTLSPRYRVAWLHLTIGWTAVIAIAIGLIVGNHETPGDLVGKLGLGLAGAVTLGFALHFLLQFQHEGAHYNLAKDRATNDRLTNAIIGVFVGEDIRNYRKIHTGHHRYLGTTKDTERSYFDALDGRFLLQGLLGLRLIRILSSRWNNVSGEHEAQSDGPSTYLTPILLVAALFNLSIVAASAATGQWVLAASWVAGSLVFLPLINATRQLLEHRDEAAHRTVDYTRVDHGAVNRLFGDGPVASVVGAAGFNRHLLHHWDPGVSYTRLRELEDFLLDTELAPFLVRRQTSYGATFRRLLLR